MRSVGRRGGRLAAGALALTAFSAGCVETRPDRPLDEQLWRETNAEVHARVAEAAFEEGRFQQALLSAREVLRLRPDDPEAAGRVARIEIARGEYERAVRAARRAVELAPEAVEGWLLLADALALAGHGEEAAEAWIEAGERGGDEIRRQAVAFLVESGRLAEARIRAERWGIDSRALAAAQARSERVLVLDWDRLGEEERAALLAAEALAAGEADEAAARFTRLARSRPEDPVVRIALGEALLAAGDVAGARAAFRAAARLDLHSRLAWFGLARAALAEGRLEEALLAADHAAAAAPSDPAVRALRAALRWRAGDTAGARREAEEVAILDPGGDFDRACRTLLSTRPGAASDEKP